MDAARVDGRGAWIASELKGTMPESEDRIAASGHSVGEQRRARSWRGKSCGDNYRGVGRV